MTRLKFLHTIKYVFGGKVFDKETETEYYYPSAIAQFFCHKWYLIKKWFALKWCDIQIWYLKTRFKIK